jgi:hypothetical protein
MTDDQKVQPTVAADPPKDNKVLCIGADFGTMHICASRSDSDEVKLTRNVFLQVNKDEIVLSELTDINYVENEDGDIFIIGEDAFRFANIFGQEVSRPMERGLISAKEIAAIDVLTLMIKNLIGDVKQKEVYCNYSVPAEAIDEGRSVTYHEKVFSRILGSLGINHSSVNEAMAIIYSECAKEKFSGIGISFGAGMSNVCLSYRGIETLKFSTARSGDWIDKNVADSLGMITNRVTNIKEKYLNLEAGFTGEKNKKRKRILEALTYYHEALMNYTIKKFIKEFDEKVDLEIEDDIPIVISGGTSLPKGFVQLFKSVLTNYELPFEVSEIRRAGNPLTAVSNGLLIHTLSDVERK